MVPKGKILSYIVDITYNELTDAQKQELARNIHLLSSDENAINKITDLNTPLWGELSNVFNEKLGYYGTKEALTFIFFQTLERVLPSVYKDQSHFMYYKYGNRSSTCAEIKGLLDEIPEPQAEQEIPHIVEPKTSQQLYRIIGTQFKATCAKDLTIEVIEILMKKGYKSITITKL